MLRFIESVKIENGELKNLTFHQKRVERTFEKFFPHLEPLDLFSNIRLAQNIDNNKIYKLRIIYADKIYDVSLEEYQIKEIKSLKLVHNDEIDYSFKYEDRSFINKLLELKENCDDILIVKNGLITDASYCNVALSDGKNWFTPKCPLLKGTKRELLLSKNMLIEKDIYLEDLGNFKEICLFNSMIEFEKVILPINCIKN